MTSPLGTLAHVGPLTRSVADAALALTVIAAPDERDVYACPEGMEFRRCGRLSKRFRASIRSGVVNPSVNIA